MKGSSFQSQLQVDPTRRTVAGVKKLAVLKRLSHLDMMYCWKLTDGAMLILSEMQSLISLNIIGCHRLSKLGKGHVQHLLDHFHAAEL